MIYASFRPLPKGLATDETATSSVLLDSTSSDAQAMYRNHWDEYRSHRRKMMGVCVCYVGSLRNGGILARGRHCVRCCFLTYRIQMNRYYRHYERHSAM